MNFIEDFSKGFMLGYHSLTLRKYNNDQLGK